MVPGKGLSALLALILFGAMTSLSVLASAQPALPTTLYGKVVYTNNTPVELDVIEISWIDNDGITRTSSATTLTYGQAVALGHPEFAGYYFFNEGYLQAQQNSMIALASRKGINSEKVLSSPGGSPVRVADLLIPDLNDRSPPQISGVEFIPEDSVVSFVTDEPATATIRYGAGAIQSSFSNSSLSFRHLVPLPGLKPFSSYIFEAVATDVVGNTKVDDNNGNYHSFSTGSPAPPAPTPNKPGSSQGSVQASESGSPLPGESGDFAPTKPTPSILPTSVHGQLTDNSGKPIENGEVVAKWTDSQGEHSMTAKTLTEKEAEKLGSPDLKGYFFFRKNLTLPPGTKLDVTSPNATSYHAEAYANPGGNSKSIVTVSYIAPSLPPPPAPENRAQSEPSKTALKIGAVEGSESPELVPKRTAAFTLLLLASLYLIFISFRKYRSKLRRPVAEKRFRNAINNVLLKKARSVMKRQPLTINDSSTFDAAINLLLKHDVGSLVVMRNEKPVGWVTEQTVTEDLILRNKKHDSTLHEASLLPLVSVKPDSTLSEANAVIASSKAGKAVVVEKGKLAGILTSTDISRTLNDFYDKNQIESESLPSSKSLIDKDFLCVERDETLAEVESKMSKSGKDCAIVIGSEPAIITDTDILGEIYMKRGLAAETRASIIAKSPITVISGDLTAFEANRVIIGSFKRLAVLQNGRIEGILTRKSVVSGLLSYLKRISALLEERRHINVTEA